MAVESLPFQGLNYQNLFERDELQLSTLFGEKYLGSVQSFLRKRNGAMLPQEFVNNLGFDEFNWKLVETSAYRGVLFVGFIKDFPNQPIENAIGIIDIANIAQNQTKEDGLTLRVSGIIKDSFDHNRLFAACYKSNQLDTLNFGLFPEEIQDNIAPIIHSSLRTNNRMSTAGIITPSMREIVDPSQEYVANLRYFQSYRDTSPNLYLKTQNVLKIGRLTLRNRQPEVCVGIRDSIGNNHWQISVPTRLD